MIGSCIVFHRNQTQTFLPVPERSFRPAQPVRLVITRGKPSAPEASPKPVSYPPLTPAPNRDLPSKSCGEAGGLPASARTARLFPGLTLSPPALLRATPALVSIKMLTAEFISLSWTMPQSGHCHSRTYNGNSSRIYPQPLQVLLEGKNRST